MWEVANGLDDGLAPTVTGDTTWTVSHVRLEFGPAATIGDLLAALGEVMSSGSVVPYDLEFYEAPEGTYMCTSCELPHSAAGVHAVLARLVHGG